MIVESLAIAVYSMGIFAADVVYVNTRIYFLKVIFFL